MTLLQKRLLLSEILDSPDGMFRGQRLRTADRIAAIKLDHELSDGRTGDGDADTMRVRVIIGGEDAEA